MNNPTEPQPVCCYCKQPIAKGDCFAHFTPELGFSCKKSAEVVETPQVLIIGCGNSSPASELIALRAQVATLTRERDEAISTMDAIDYHRIKVRDVGYRGRYGYEAYVADPGGHYEEERQRTIGLGATPMEAIREGLKTEKD